MKESKQREIFDGWIDQHKGLLFKILRAYAFTAEDQEDLFQEITLQVWRSIPNFRQESAVTTWLYRISLNTALKWKSREQKHISGRSPIDYASHVLQGNQHLVDERLEWLYEEIAHLNEIDRSLCLLLLDDFSYREMSKILGVSESNVAVKIHRVKKHLVAQSKKMYQDHEV